MKYLIVTLLLLVASAAMAQTFLGSCGLSNITGIQLSTGKIYCFPTPSSCINKLDFSIACDSQYIAVI